MKQSILTLAIMAILTFGISLVSNAQTKPAIPDEYKTKENPYAGDESLKMLGLRNYNRHCVSCHGKKGEGDGIMAKNLKKSPGDLTKLSQKNYTDGELFYMSFIGVEERPDFIKLIPDDEEKWAIVNYIKTLEGQ